MLPHLSFHLMQVSNDGLHITKKSNPPGEDLTLSGGEFFAVASLLRWRIDPKSDLDAMS